MKLGWNFIRRLLDNTKDVQHVGIGNIAGKVIVGIFWFYMATVLGSENYGQVSYLIALGSMGAAISMVGTSNTLIVYTAKKSPYRIRSLFNCTNFRNHCCYSSLYIFVKHYCKHFCFWIYFL